MPPWPFLPLKFSGLIERVFAADSRARVPRCMPRPLKRAILCSIAERIQAGLLYLHSFVGLRQQGTFGFFVAGFRPAGPKNQPHTVKSHPFSLLPAKNQPRTL